MSRIVLFLFSLFVGLTVARWLTRSPLEVGRSELRPEYSLTAVQEEAEAELVDPLGPQSAPVAPQVEKKAALSQPSLEQSASPDRTRALDPITMIHGRLRDTSGLPMPSFSLFAIDSTGKWHRGRTDKSGRYGVLDLPAGPVEIRLGSHLHYALQERIEIAAGEVLEQDFVVERAVVVPLWIGSAEGVPLRDLLKNAKFRLRPEVSAFATKEKPGFVLTPPHPGGNNPYGAGSWWSRRMCELEATSEPDAYGGIVLSGPGPVWISLAVNQQVLRTEYVARPEDGVHWDLSVEDLRALQGSLLVKLVDALTDEPFPASELPLVSFGRHGEFQPDTDGWLRIEGIPSGVQDVVVRAPGCAIRERTVRIEPGEQTDLGVWRVEPSVPFGGRVANAQGDPLALRLRAERLDVDGGRRSGGLDSMVLESDTATGKFYSASFAAGLYLLRVVGDDEVSVPHADPTIWTSRGVVVDTRSGALESLLIEALNPTSVRIEVLGGEGDLQLLVQEPGGLVLRRKRVNSEGPVSLKLPPGELVLVLMRRGEELTRKEIQIGDEAVSVALEWP